MTVFEGSLYVGTINQTDGAQVWRYDDGTTGPKSMKMGSET
jgi:hypothetical protein